MITFLVHGGTISCPELGKPSELHHQLKSYLELYGSTESSSGKLAYQGVDIIYTQEHYILRRDKQTASLDEPVLWKHIAIIGSKWKCKTDVSILVSKPIILSSFLALLLSAGFVTARPADTSASAGDVLLARADGYCDTSYTRYITTVNSWRIKYPSLSSGGTCIMNTGAKGSGVRSVQEAINKCYGGGLQMDGDYGERTKSAVKLVQRKIGVAQDGKWGPKTGTKMDFWGAMPARPDRPDLGDVHRCVSLS
ncbi:hypothetical protein QBC43DRAFT_335962 [Cladorrhinum sp. PSN259]|nr:hypothetical protein QBC43DRAFT_335962 [Cladorrhinum sp. PSN259]